MYSYFLTIDHTSRTNTPKFKLTAESFTCNKNKFPLQTTSMFVLIDRHKHNFLSIVSLSVNFYLI